MVQSKAIILFSGGIDSSTTLAMAKSFGHEIYALSFNYGQRHKIELDRAKQISSIIGVQAHKIIDIDLRFFGNSALTDDIKVPKDQHGKSIVAPITYVPARNTIFLSYALAWAEVIKASDIFIGANIIDYSNYPDCRPEYIASFEKMANLATVAGVSGKTIKIHAPLLLMSKENIIRKGIELGVNYYHTLSCYDPTEDGQSCGHCDSCIIRLNAFDNIGMKDPIDYATH